MLTEKNKLFIAAQVYELLGKLENACGILGEDGVIDMYNYVQFLVDNQRDKYIDSKDY